MSPAPLNIALLTPDSHFLKTLTSASLLHLDAPAGDLPSFLIWFYFLSFLVSSLWQSSVQTDNSLINLRFGVSKTVTQVIRLERETPEAGFHCFSFAITTE